MGVGGLRETGQARLGSLSGRCHHPQKPALELADSSFAAVPPDARVRRSGARPPHGGGAPPAGFSCAMAISMAVPMLPVEVVSKMASFAATEVDLSRVRQICRNFGVRRCTMCCGSSWCSEPFHEWASC